MKIHESRSCLTISFAVHKRNKHRPGFDRPAPGIVEVKVPCQSAWSLRSDLVSTKNAPDETNAELPSTGVSACKRILVALPRCVTSAS